MTSAIEQQPNPRSAVAQPCGLLRPAGMGCSLTAGHEPPCVPVQMEPPASDSPVESEPAAPVASEPPKKKEYGFSKPMEFDFETPNGDRVRLRKLRRTEIVKMGLHHAVNDFSPELLKIINPESGMSPEDANQKAIETLVQVDMFDRVLVAACVCPSFTPGDPDLETVEIEDKLAIFAAVMPAEMQQAALEAQQEALKSVLDQPASSVRDLPDGEAVRSAAE